MVVLHAKAWPAHGGKASASNVWVRVHKFKRLSILLRTDRQGSPAFSVWEQGTSSALLCIHVSKIAQKRHGWSPLKPNPSPTVPYLCQRDCQWTVLWIRASCTATIHGRDRDVSHTRAATLDVMQRYLRCRYEGVNDMCGRQGQSNEHVMQQAVQFKDKWIHTMVHRPVSLACAVSRQVHQ